jgi:hypothetical protein
MTPPIFILIQIREVLELVILLPQLVPLENGLI